MSPSSPRGSASSIPRPPHAWRVAGPILAGFAFLTLTCGGAILWLATRRRRFWRLPRRSQRLAAAAVFASVFLVHLCYGAFVFGTLLND